MCEGQIVTLEILKEPAKNVLQELRITQASNEKKNVSTVSYTAHDHKYIHCWKGKCLSNQ
jgi:hypothetical protein